LSNRLSAVLVGQALPERPLLALLRHLSVVRVCLSNQLSTDFRSAAQAVVPVEVAQGGHPVAVVVRH